MILIYLVAIINCLVPQLGQSVKMGPVNIEINDEKSYWELYKIVHQAGDLPILSMEDVEESLVKLHEFTNKLSIDKTRRSFINQRIGGLLNMRDSKDCSTNLVQQLSHVEDENQDYTMYLVPFTSKKANDLLDHCTNIVANEITRLRDAKKDLMAIFNKLLDNVLRAPITEGDNPIPGFDSRLPVARPYDYLPHQKIVNGLIDYLDENHRYRQIGNINDFYASFDTKVMRPLTDACKDIMLFGESTLNKFDAIYEADNTKVNSFDDKALNFLAGLRVCEHLKYVTTNNILSYYKTHMQRTNFNINTRNHQLSIKTSSRRS